MMKKTAGLSVLTATITLLGTHSSKAIEVDTTQDYEIITVTAKGIEQKPIEVPFTVNVIDGDEITARHLDSLEKAVSTVPGVSLHNSGDVSYNGIWIRGSGSMSQTSTLDDNSVGVTIDGISYGKVGLSQNLFDIEQVEFAKGPQGTLFGSNTEAGAISVKTKDPVFERGSSISLRAADNHLRSGAAVINTPINDYWALRIAGLYSEREHYIYRKENDSPLVDLKNQGIRAKLLWQGKSGASTLITFGKDERENYMPLALVPKFDKNPKYRAGNIPHNSSRKNQFVSLRFKMELAQASIFESKTSYAKHNAHFRKSALALDIAALSLPPVILPLLNDPVFNTQQQYDDIQFYEQEFRLTSVSGSSIQWVSGIHLSRKDRGFKYNALNNFIFASALNAELARQYKIDAQSIYGEIALPVQGLFRVLGGARLGKEKNLMTASYLPNRTTENPFAAVGKRTDRQIIDDNFVTWRLGLDKDINRDWRFFTLFSSGYKSAGFSDFDTNIAYGKTTPIYKNGKIDTLEIGLKGGSSNGRWATSFTFFKNHTKNDKVTVNTIIPFSSTPFNVDTQALGFEIDAYRYLTNNMRLNTIFAYTDTKVIDVPDIAVSVTQKGNTLPMTPKASGSMGIEHIHLLAKGAFFGIERIVSKLNLNYVGKRAAEPNNHLTLDAYTTASGSISVVSDYGTLSLWGINLTNETYETMGVHITGTMYAGVPAERRVIGLSYSMDF